MADDSHEMSRLIFSEKTNKKKNKKTKKQQQQKKQLSSAAVEIGALRVNICSSGSG